MPNRILTCKDCGETKETHAYGLCQACYQRQARKTNPEKNREYARLNYYRHREDKLAKQRERDVKRKEEKATYDKGYRVANHEKRRLQWFAYQVGHQVELAIAKTRYDQSLEGKAVKERYNQSLEGKVSQARRMAKRRGRSTNSDLYGARVELLYILKESCAICGAPYKRSYQIDHITALCNGGIDEWDNFQPVCYKCHKKKTKQDMKEYYNNTRTFENIRN